MINFSTKARTLEAFRPLLKKSKICESVYFTVNDWSNNSHKIIERIQERFGDGNIIVRSSTVNEDRADTTMAGAFHSCMNIDPSSKNEIEGSISEVIKSYGELPCDNDEVLIQRMIHSVSMSGVIFSHDLNTGAPYYVVNYDDLSGKTDTITSGNGDTSRTLLIYRTHIHDLQSSRFRRLLEAVKEIEELSSSPGLDIEFAVTKDETIFIFQVRRLAVQENWNRNISIKIDTSLKEIAGFLEGRFQARHNIAGHTSIFGEMPDWNPAEMIGPAPRPLSRSLYENLITNSVWAEARAEMGYRDLSGRPLMVNFGGRVYIDVRESFNSFLPNDLEPAIAEKLVCSWLNRLKSKPELHDKIEFEVAITSYAFDFGQKIAFLSNILSEEEVEKIKKSLKRLTNDIILGKRAGIREQLDKIEYLDNSRKALLNKSSQGNQINIVRDLLNDCKIWGTKPFSILARDAFIAESFLRSMEALNLLKSKRIASFRRSISTILTEFLISMEALQKNKLKQEEFIERFGHLRPGTYDILAIRYSKREKMESFGPVSLDPLQVSNSFEFSDAEKMSVNQALNNEKFEFDSDVLFDFIRKAISGREYAKFIFSRNISDALELIAEWGVTIGLNREELSFLTIDQIFQTLTHTFHEPIETRLRNLSEEALSEYEITQALRLPYLISSIEDIYIVPLLKSRPNFITKKRMECPLYYLSGHEIQSSCPEGHIILTERADPGHDWIFLNPISGLITKYGGSNSHMAIRCAELGIPAAIGCGEQLFESLQQSNRVLLDCGSKLIIPIQ